jgi:hypothetical protein
MRAILLVQNGSAPALPPGRVLANADGKVISSEILTELCQQELVSRCPGL